MVPFQAAVVESEETLFVSFAQKVFELQITVKLRFCDVGKGHSKGALSWRKQVSWLHTSRMIRVVYITADGFSSRYCPIFLFEHPLSHFVYIILTSSLGDPQQIPQISNEQIINELIQLQTSLQDCTITLTGHDPTNTVGHSQQRLPVLSSLGHYLLKLGKVSRDLFQYLVADGPPHDHTGQVNVIHSAYTVYMQLCHTRRVEILYSANEP